MKMSPLVVLSFIIGIAQLVGCQKAAGVLVSEAEASTDSDTAEFALTYGRGRIDGKWGGLLTGTFQGQPFFENYSTVIDDNGRHSLGTNDSVVGTSHNECQLTTFDRTTGFYVGPCTELDGVAQGLTSQAHVVLTDRGDQVGVWIVAPGLAVSGYLHRQ